MSELLSIRGLKKSYGAVKALRGVDLEVRAGELLGIIGPNGSGKSTLFDCCTGLQLSDAGTVLLDGQDITRWPLHRVAREGRFIRSFQKTVVFETMTPRESSHHSRSDVRLSLAAIDIRHRGGVAGAQSRACGAG